MKRASIFTLLLATLFSSSCASQNSSETAQMIQSRFANLKSTKERSVSDKFSPISEITPEIESRMRAGNSYRDGCPVPLEDLRYLRIKYFGFDKKTHTGEMIVHRDVADEVVTIFDKLYRIKYPIRKMRLVSSYGGDDDRSMSADNTSAFNCRRVTGGHKWSKHSFGRAIDINPKENPYVKRGKILPPSSKNFAKNRKILNRRDKSVIIKNSQIVDIFSQHGWIWGGSWKSLKDYQHFEKK